LSNIAGGLGGGIGGEGDGVLVIGGGRLLVVMSGRQKVWGAKGRHGHTFEFSIVVTL